MLLDSCFLIDLLADEERATKKLLELVLRDEHLSVSALSVMEVEVGLHAASADRFDRAMDRMEPLPFDTETAHTAATLQRDLRTSGAQIGTVDAMIAATALEHGHAVLTRNVAEFERVPDLTVESY